MVADGVDVVIVEGPTTADADDERRWVVDAVEILAGRCRSAVRTTRPEVARAAAAVGADLFDDPSGVLVMAAAVAGVGLIVHPPTGPRRPADGNDVVTATAAALEEMAARAAAAGVTEIWVDPALAGHDIERDVTVLANLDMIVAAGRPVVVDTGRTDTVGHLVARSDGSDGPAPVEERLVGSVVASTLAVVLGADGIRVHDVQAARQATTVFAGEQHPRRP